MASTNRSRLLSSYGNYEKELADLKELLQQTLEEIKACCISRHPKSDDHGDPDASATDQDLIKDINEEASKIVEELERRRSTAAEERFSNDGLSQLRHAIEEDHQQFVTLIHGTHENLTQVRHMHHLEALKAIQQNRVRRGHQSK